MIMNYVNTDYCEHLFKKLSEQQCIYFEAFSKYLYLKNPIELKCQTTVKLVFLSMEFCQ